MSPSNSSTSYSTNKWVVTIAADGKLTWEGDNGTATAYLSDGNNTWHLYSAYHSSMIYQYWKQTYTAPPTVDPTVTAPTPATNSTYDGNAKQLITTAADSNSSGTLYYGLGTSSTDEPSNWYASISDSNLMKTDCDTYYIWYKQNAATGYNAKAATYVGSVTISKATSYTVPSGLTALRGQTLADVELPTGWAWADTSTSLTNAGDYTFKADYTPADTANYNSVENVDVPVTVNIPTHTVTWNNYDGTLLEKDENVEEDTTPVYDGETPEKPADVQYAYTFSGWTPEISAVTGDVTYTALFDEFAVIHEDDVFVNSTEGNPEVFVTDCHAGAVLTAGTDYTLAVNDDNTVTITGKGSYVGEVTKDFAVLPRKMNAEIGSRTKVGKNTKVVITGKWYLPEGAEITESGIARLYTDKADSTIPSKYDVYSNGTKKDSKVKALNTKYTYALLMNSTNAAKNLYAVTYVTYTLDGKTFTSISDVAQG